MPFSPIELPSRRRLVAIAIVIFTLFSCLIAQFFVIQILQGEKWLAQAEKQHIFYIKEPFIRGVFYSNPFIKNSHPQQATPFVVDVPKFHLFADCLSIPQERKAEVASILASRFSLHAKDSMQLSEQLKKRSRNRRLASWLNLETHQQVLKWWSGYAKKHKIARNALFFVKDYQRCYPFGNLLGQVLHTIRSQKEEETQQGLPTGGLELYFNSYLKGQQGKRRLMRSPRHALETGKVITSPENGADIYLTIDPCLQAIAEEEIKKGVDYCFAKCGWVVMMEPKTGQILALAQYPSFDLANYQRYFNDPDLIEHTKVKAVTDANEPGSVFKPFTIAIALKANQYLIEKGERPLFSPEEKIDTKSGQFPGRSRPISDTRVHHFMNLDMAIQKSSNIYMGRLVERIIDRIGEAWFREQIQLFGFGVKTKIELPAESAGVVPTPGKRHPNGTLEWSTPTPFSIAMGYNLQSNSIQIARALSVLANGGYLNQPTLVRKIVKKSKDGKQEVLIDHTQELNPYPYPQIIDESIAKRVVEAMCFVNKHGGTAVKANVPGYKIAGKTSTPKKIVNGRYSEKLYCPIYGGIAPAEQPKFVMVVTMDEPRYGFVPGIGKRHNGGNCTATVFRAIAKRAFDYLGVAPDDLYDYPYGDPRRDLKQSTSFLKRQQLQKLYNQWNQLPAK